MNKENQEQVDGIARPLTGHFEVIARHSTGEVFATCSVNNTIMDAGEDIVAKLIKRSRKDRLVDHICRNCDRLSTFIYKCKCFITNP